MALKVKGCKRHLLVDTEGFVLKAKVHSAKVMDYEGIKLLLEHAEQQFWRLSYLWLDAGYRGEDKGKDWIVNASGLRRSSLRRYATCRRNELEEMGADMAITEAMLAQALLDYFQQDRVIEDFQEFLDQSYEIGGDVEVSWHDRVPGKALAVEVRRFSQGGGLTWEQPFTMKIDKLR
jgi:hypothetical protein